MNLVKKMWNQSEKNGTNTFFAGPFSNNEVDADDDLRIKKKTSTKKKSHRRENRLNK